MSDHLPSFYFLGAGESAAQLILHLWNMNNEIRLYDDILNSLDEKYAAESIIVPDLKKNNTKISFKPLNNTGDLKGTIRDLPLNVDINGTFDSLNCLRVNIVIKEKNNWVGKEWVNWINDLDSYQKAIESDNKTNLNRFYFIPPETTENTLKVFDKQYWVKWLLNENGFKRILRIIENNENSYIENNKDKIFADYDDNTNFVITPWGSSDGYGVVKVQRNNIVNGIKYAERNARTSNKNEANKGCVIRLFKDFKWESYIYCGEFKDKIIVSKPIYYKRTQLEDCKTPEDNRPLRTLGYTTKIPEIFNSEIEKKLIETSAKLFRNLQITCFDESTRKYKDKLYPFLGFKFGIYEHDLEQYEIELLSIKYSPCDIGVLSGISHKICQNSLFLMCNLSRFKTGKAVLQLKDSNGKNFFTNKESIIRTMKIEKDLNVLINGYIDENSYYGIPLTSTRQPFKIKQYNEFWSSIINEWSDKTQQYNGFWGSKINKWFSKKKKKFNLLFQPLSHLFLLYYKPLDERRKNANRIYGHFCSKAKSFDNLREKFEAFKKSLKNYNRDNEINNYFHSEIEKMINGGIEKIKKNIKNEIDKNGK